MSTSRKLTPDQVQAIRDRLAAGERGKVLAADYGVTESAISRIRTGKHYPLQADPAPAEAGPEAA